MNNEILRKATNYSKPVLDHVLSAVLMMDSEREEIQRFVASHYITQHSLLPPINQQGLIWTDLMACDCDGAPVRLLLFHYSPVQPLCCLFKTPLYDRTSPGVPLSPSALGAFSLLIY